MGNIVKTLTAADLHRGKRLYDELARAVAAHKPDVVALVGDFLDALGTASEQYPTPEAATLLSNLPCQEIVFVRGNHEDSDWWNFADAWAKTGRKLTALHGEVFLHGPLAIVGFPCGLGDETAYLGIREPLPEPPDKWLSKLVRRYGPVMRTLWLLHEPPTGTPLTEKSGPVSGNPAWNEALARFSPWLTVSGHDHQSPIINKRWHHKVGHTTCVNLGQTSDGPLHYGLIEARFPKGTPCLPSQMRISAFPWNQSLDVIPNQPKDTAAQG
jgi:Icc-related predicted phosphoesterase